MGKHHTTAAVSVELQLRQRLAFRASIEKQGQVGIPLITHNLAAAKAAYWDNLVWSANSFYTPSRGAQWKDDTSTPGGDQDEAKNS
ncbi:hypothetical protein Malapachy_2457 [Malassezia pachydermatis]|uniref:Uncharacterized protein n=1 Tax=Malassezia pachydermatis TaxID=77020 RepID=A0A0M9VQB3_9BASI|nr:hypothetical protein Malapachy_2457 [Malassezia pachydermatis]KOS15362.1 hypothetical protein Malapachy_2457 [Malassezia pachydermatis]